MSFLGEFMFVASLHVYAYNWEGNDREDVGDGDGEYTTMGAVLGFKYEQFPELHPEGGEFVAPGKKTSRSDIELQPGMATPYLALISL